MGTILVVDDDPPICTLLADLLRDEGYGVETAVHGQNPSFVLPNATWH